jgi:hypothetical protein
MSSKPVKKKILFKNIRNPGTGALVCPSCFEHLAHLDLENFSECPYCEFKFETGPDLEDFLLKPVVDYWVSQYNVPLPAREDRGPFIRIGRV